MAKRACGLVFLLFASGLVLEVEAGVPSTALTSEQLHKQRDPIQRVVQIEDGKTLDAGSAKGTSQTLRISQKVEGKSEAGEDNSASSIMVRRKPKSGAEKRRPKPSPPASNADYIAAANGAETLKRIINNAKKSGIPISKALANANAVNALAAYAGITDQKVINKAVEGVAKSPNETESAKAKLKLILEGLYGIDPKTVPANQTRGLYEKMLRDIVDLDVDKHLVGDGGPFPKDVINEYLKTGNRAVLDEARKGLVADAMGIDLENAAKEYGRQTGLELTAKKLAGIVAGAALAGKDPTKAGFWKQGGFKDLPKRGLPGKKRPDVGAGRVDGTSTAPDASSGSVDKTVIGGGGARPDVANRPDFTGDGSDTGGGGAGTDAGTGSGTGAGGPGIGKTGVGSGGTGIASGSGAQGSRVGGGQPVGTGQAGAVPGGGTQGTGQGVPGGTGKGVGTGDQMASTPGASTVVDYGVVSHDGDGGFTITHGQAFINADGTVDPGSTYTEHYVPVEGEPGLYVNTETGEKFKSNSPDGSPPPEGTHPETVNADGSWTLDDRNENENGDQQETAGNENDTSNENNDSSGGGCDQNSGNCSENEGDDSGGESETASKTDGQESTPNPADDGGGRSGELAIVTGGRMGSDEVERERKGIGARNCATGCPEDSGSSGGGPIKGPEGGHIDAPGPIIERPLTEEGIKAIELKKGGGVTDPPETGGSTSGGGSPDSGGVPPGSGAGPVASSVADQAKPAIKRVLGSGTSQRLRQNIRNNVQR